MELPDASCRMPRALPLAVLFVILTGVVILTKGAIQKEGNVLGNVIDDGKSKTISYLSLPVHVAYVSAPTANSTPHAEPDSRQVNRCCLEPQDVQQSPIICMRRHVGMDYSNATFFPGAFSSWQEAPEQYLIPLLTNGPNNQVRGLKWALALSKALGRCVCSGHPCRLALLHLLHVQ